MYLPKCYLYNHVDVARTCGTNNNSLTTKSLKCMASAWLLLLVLIGSPRHSFSIHMFIILTLKVLVTTIDAQWEGMGDIGVGEVRAGTTSPMPDHKGFKLQ